MNELVPVGDANLVVEAGRLLGIQGLGLAGGRYNVSFEQGTYDEVFGGTPPTFDADAVGALEAANEIFALINANGTFVDLPENMGGCSSIEFCGIAIPFNGPYATGLPSTPFAVDVQTAFFEDGPSDGVFSQPLATGELFTGEITFAVFTYSTVSFSTTVVGASGPLASVFPGGEAVNVSYQLEPGVQDTNPSSDAGIYPDATLSLSFDFPGLGITAEFSGGTVQTFDNTPNPDDQVFVFGDLNQNGATIEGEVITSIEMDYTGTTSMLSSDALPTSIPPHITSISVYVGTASGHAWVQLAPVTPGGPGACAGVTEIPVAECEALVALYESTDGDNWANTSGWLTSTAPCTWFGVDCSAGHVVSVGFAGNSGNNLTGPLPAELANLTEVRSLRLHDNQLNGPIPPELGSLVRLEHLWLSRNGLSGTTPPALGSLTNLLSLTLDGNQLTGPIPPALGDLRNLRQLSLSDNQLTGGFEPALGELTSLEYLGLGRNPLEIGSIDAIPFEAWPNLRGIDLFLTGLTGEIPAEVGELTSLQVLSLAGNALGGAIPDELGALSGLFHLTLADNQLTGAIPGVLGTLTGLAVLDLSGNELTGAIPASFGGLASMQQLFLGGNQLTGPIPAELGGLNQLIRLTMENNLLSGPIPEALGNLTSLDRLFLQGNQLSGIVPLAVAEVGVGATICHLWGNDALVIPDLPEYRDLTDPPGQPICGLPLATPTVCSAVSEIPQGECEALVAFYEATNGASWFYDGDWLETTTPCSWHGVGCTGGSVTSLNLTSNGMSGTIPGELGDLSGLQYLALYSNQLAGPIPPELARLQSLSVLALENNQLTGSFPAELGNLSSLRYLSLHLNGLTGSIPTEFGNLTELRAVSLYDNQLTGPIPASLGDLANLQDLQLQSNQLSGAIPAELGRMARLVRMWLHENALTGAIPPELANLSNLQYLELHSNQLVGTIPPELGRLGALSYLRLQSNQLTGSIPAELGDLSELLDLELHDNDLTGVVPPELGGLARLGILQLQRNRLTGEIPQELGGLGRVRWLDLSGNGLTGTIPSELGGLGDLLVLHLQGNQLEGLVPLDVALRGGQLQVRSGNEVCSFVPPGNTDLYMPDTEAYRGADQDADGLVCGLPLTAEPETVADDAVELVEELNTAGVTNGGQTTALTRKIDQALRLVDKGDYSEAIEVLRGFIEQLSDLVADGRLTEAEAAPLIEAAEILIELIEDEMAT